MIDNDHLKREIDNTDDTDEVCQEIDVVTCQLPDNSELYRVQYPARKVDPYHTAGLKVRYKKNVKMLEMKMLADRHSASYDRDKAENLASISQGHRGTVGSSIAPILDEETYCGQSYPNNAPLHYAVGFFKNGRLHLCPLKGTFEMHRSLAYMNNQGKSKNSDEGAVKVEVEAESEGAPSPLRVRFARPETEWQKKRREASSLHRSKVIEKDPWLDLNVYTEEAKESCEKRDSFIGPVIDESEVTCDAPDTEQLISEAIVGEKLAALDLTKSDQLISLRRIRHLPLREQVKALLLKAKMISTTKAREYISPLISRAEFIEDAQKCSHLVCGIWVLSSELIYKKETQAPLIAARDIALCLMNADLPVRRDVLHNAFGISITDLDDVFSTFAVQISVGGEKKWVLKVEPDTEFGKSKNELEVLVKERRYWHKRWEEIHKFDLADSEKASIIKGRQRTPRQRNGPRPARRSASGTKAVVID
ncbi:hypothetical protein AB6A40_004025 [Gnathostoma spinigerum]|uniref:DNA-directed RNA polymerase III subunit RPC5 n=1 Tax=Gnathostoma spinigerum TaxID=75299 RepID=A0ABD6ECD3_9BILA